MEISTPTAAAHSERCAGVRACGRARVCRRTKPTDGVASGGNKETGFSDRLRFGFEFLSLSPSRSQDVNVPARHPMAEPLLHALHPPRPSLVHSGTRLLLQQPGRSGCSNCGNRLPVMVVWWSRRIIKGPVFIRAGGRYLPKTILTCLREPVEVVYVLRLLRRSVGFDLPCLGVCVIACICLSAVRFSCSCACVRAFAGAHFRIL